MAEMVTWREIQTERLLGTGKLSRQRIEIVLAGVAVSEVPNPRPRGRRWMKAWRRIDVEGVRQLREASVRLEAEKAAQLVELRKHWVWLNDPKHEGRRNISPFDGSYVVPCPCALGDCPFKNPGKRS